MVVDMLHAAHQGISLMEAQAHATCFWPGITREKNRARASCEECTKNAPSKPYKLLQPCSPQLPTYYKDKKIRNFTIFLAICQFYTHKIVAVRPITKVFTHKIFPMVFWVFTTPKNI